MKFAASFIAIATIVSAPDFAHGFQSYLQGLPNGSAFPKALGHSGRGYTAFGQMFSGTWSASLCAQTFPGSRITVGQAFGDPCCKWTKGGKPDFAVRFTPDFPAQSTQTCPTAAAPPAPAAPPQPQPQPQPQPAAPAAPAAQPPMAPPQPRPAAPAAQPPIAPPQPQPAAPAPQPPMAPSPVAPAVQTAMAPAQPAAPVPQTPASAPQPPAGMVQPAGGQTAVAAATPGTVNVVNTVGSSTTHVQQVGSAPATVTTTTNDNGWTIFLNDLIAKVSASAGSHRLRG